MPVILVLILVGVYSFLGLLNAGLLYSEEPAFAIGSALGSLAIMWFCYWATKKSIIFIKSH